LETIVLKAIDKDPHRRYPSADELAEDLRRFQTGEPIAARRAGRLERTWRWCRRNPAVAASLAAVVVSLALGTGIAAWLAIEANAALAREHKARSERALAQAEALLAAAPEAVPDILNGLQPHLEEVRPRLREVWDEPDRPHNRAQRLRAGLALLPGDTTGV